MESSSSSSSSHKLPLSIPDTPPSVLKVTENEELLILILSLLPTKSVTRFKSVSKHWLFLISDSYFSLLHTSLSPKPVPSSLLFPQPNNSALLHHIPLLFTPSTSTSSSFLTFTQDPTGEIELLQSCNGLLLCSSGSSWDGIETRLFYIFNPTTNKFNTLPPPPNPTPLYVSLSMFTKISLAFDPSRSPYYKVLLVRKVERGTDFFQLDIYCSKTGEWIRRCGDHVEWQNFEVFCKGVYVNGALHWASKRDGFLCFDVERECFKVMPALPDLRNEGITVRYLGASSGKLYLVDSRDLEFDVFEMGKDCSGWVLKYQNSLEQFFRVYPRVVSQGPQCDFGLEKTKISLISVVREGDELCLVLHVRGKILSYNLENGGMKVIRKEFLSNVESIIPALIQEFRGYQLVESLSCV